MVRSFGLVLLVAVAAVATAAPAKKYGGMSAEDRLKLMLRCNAVTDQTQRANCYDDAARQALAVDPSAASSAPPPPSERTVAPVPGVASASAPASAAPARAAPSAEQAFGMDSIDTARRPKENHPDIVRLIHARITAKTDQEGFGYWLYTLDNGMIWKMTERNPLELPGVGDEATIRRGPIGGYMLDVGRHSSVKVVRLQ